MNTKSKISTGAIHSSVGFSGFTGNNTYTSAYEKSAKKIVKKIIDITHLKFSGVNAA